MMTRIILYDLLYIILSTLILGIAMNINMISVSVNNMILSLFVSIGCGLSWVATLIPIGIVISLIKFVEKKR